MKQVKYLIVCLLCCISGIQIVSAQSQSDLSVTGEPNMGTYPGYPMSGYMNVDFANYGPDQVLTIPGGDPVYPFFIQIQLPAGFQWNSTYPDIPAGWTYDPQPSAGPNGGGTINLRPTSGSFPAVPSPGFYTNFHVPFTTMGPNPSGTFVIQIVQTAAYYEDNNTDNDEVDGPVTVLGTPLGVVTFKSFEAKANGCQVDLNWKTSEEKQGMTFEVQRSTNGRDYTTLDAVIAKAGASGIINHYNYIDANPINGKSTYRIRQTEVGKSAFLSDSRMVMVNCGTTNYDIYPNPGSGIFYLTGLRDKAVVEVFNALGQLVKKQNTEKVTEAINLSMLKDGTYFVNVKSNGQIVYSSKIVKVQK